MKTVIYSQSFIESLCLSVECYNIAHVLLKTREQCREFYIGFLGRNKNKLDDLLDYREHRLSLSDNSVNKFLERSDNKVKQDVFEDVFLQRFTLEEIMLIEEAISEKRTSLEAMYNCFELNVNENILKNVL